MREVTVSASRLPIWKGSRVPGYPDLTVGRYLGGSPYTFDRIYDLEKKDGSSPGLVIKVCWQPLGVPLGMSMRALEHEWVMYNNMEVFCEKNPEVTNKLLHAKAAIFTSDTPSSIFGCWPGIPFSQQRRQHNLTTHLDQQRGQQQQQQQQQRVVSGSSGSSSNECVQIRDVTPAEAADSVSSTTSMPKRTIAALIIEKADGLTVKQRIKPSGFTDIRYIAQLLLQMPPLLSMLEQQLGFVHDDLRLDNIMDVCGTNSDNCNKSNSHHAANVEKRHNNDNIYEKGKPAAAAATGAVGLASKQQRQQQWRQISGRAVLPADADPSSSSSGEAVPGGLAPAGDHVDCESVSNPQQQQQQQQQQTAPDDQPQKARSSGSSSSSSLEADHMFKLFDFGLSIINPDHHSRRPDSRAPPERKKDALKELQQQGYAFHKALGVVNLVHVVQFGSAADMYRLCKSLTKRLNRRTWPTADRLLVEAVLQLLATVSGTAVTAYFQTDAESRESPQQRQQRRGSDDSSSSSNDLGLLGDAAAKIKVNIAVQPSQSGSSSSSRGCGSKLGKFAGWWQQRQQRRRMHKEAIVMTAGQLMTLQQYQRLKDLMQRDSKA